jgi:hypothetical protein
MSVPDAVFPESLTVLEFFTPAGLSVLFAWLVSRSIPRPPVVPRWRFRFGSVGLVVSTVGLVLEAAFLVRQYAFSYLPADNLPIWLVVSWAAALSWLIALCAAIFGTGKLRWLLLAYVLTSILGGYLFVATHA